jgi:hypothetical protein
VFSSISLRQDDTHSDGCLQHVSIFAVDFTLTHSGFFCALLVKPIVNVKARLCLHACSCLCHPVATVHEHMHVYAWQLLSVHEHHDVRTYGMHMPDGAGSRLWC